jgi:aminopeptidase 2
MASILFKMVTWYSLLTASLLFYLPIANAKPYNSWLEFAKRSHGEHTHHSPLTIHQRGYKGGRSTINSTSSISPGGLPTNIIPKHYDVTIEPDSSYLEFNGVVIIDLDVVQDSNSITFNSARLNLTGTNLIVSSKTGQSWQW